MLVWSLANEGVGGVGQNQTLIAKFIFSLDYLWVITCAQFMEKLKIQLFFLLVMYIPPPTLLLGATMNMACDGVKIWLNEE